MLVLCGWKNYEVELETCMIQCMKWMSLEGDFRAHILEECRRYDRIMARAHGRGLAALLDKKERGGSPKWVKPRNAELIWYFPENPDLFHRGAGRNPQRSNPCPLPAANFYLS